MTEAGIFVVQVQSFLGQESDRLSQPRRINPFNTSAATANKLALTPTVPSRPGSKSLMRPH